MRQLQIGLIGAGIFAREAHVPAWRALDEHARIAAIWSRTPENAAALARELPGAETEADLDSLLARPDIDIVDIVLPIDSQPEIVVRALAAGKHVISEKPIAQDMATARQAIDLWRSSGREWMVAENWRYESAWERVAEIVRAGEIGEPLTATWALYTGMSSHNKYYNTPWRRTGTIKGGFLLDGGVHHIAALRQILGEVVAVQAFVRQARSDLPPADTVSATLEFASGALGSYVASYAAAAGWDPALHIVGSDGSLRADRGWIEQTRGDQTERIDLAVRDGVHRELAAFVDALQGGAPHRNTPAEALADLAVIEAMFDSAAGGGVRLGTAASATRT